MSLLPRKRKVKGKKKATIVNNNNDGDVFVFAESTGPVTIAATPSGSLVAGSKRKADDGNDSSNGSTWASEEKKTKAKYMKVYLTSMYQETNFGDSENEAEWILNSVSITKILRKFHEELLKGAEMCKKLGDHRIFLTPGQSELVLKDVVDNSKFDFVENEVVLACRNMQKTVKTLDPEQAENAIDMIKVNHQNKQIKIACAIALSVMNQTDRLYAVGEATLIIESLRPFLLHCVLSQLKGVEGECPSSAINYELFFVEVKRKGNYANGTGESDTVKLGKEMKIALDNLMIKKVKNPEIVGIVVEDHTAIVFKMDLCYNGQYRMVELSKFLFFSHMTDEILLLPDILEKLAQVKRIIGETVKKVYAGIEEDDPEDHSNFIRATCEIPILTVV
ncbi:hypothetical protein RO3G_01011 [Rhizopus delemar RA 99-880]|uniref:Uncharacterized protein n=1 Tax=Rhizopus delemar (strain RA 99-880 / ATCC MYA-4621 / FGSC 9543 / NRRL 43880) TaxID=246409 RepID=I1BJC7_RHIO9|nr:hypothetical protein RO3G_01011 [Rhizopus delemar RA 99-880]|eukprot:EIE76307.1 hypothetical protein RO3G_01011 [Rhizopus delemar RA 99-880]